MAKLPVIPTMAMPVLWIQPLVNPAGKASKNIATAKDAPGVAPVRNGPASGFLKSVCMARPLMERPIPASAADITLGKRNVKNTSSPKFMPPAVKSSQKSIQHAKARVKIMAAFLKVSGLQRKRFPGHLPQARDGKFVPSHARPGLASQRHNPTSHCLLFYFGFWWR